MSTTTDVVAVFDSSLAQLFTTARPIKAMIKEASKLMEHPVETGATVTDHRIFTPVEIELSLVFQSSDTAGLFAQIKAAWKSLTPLSVQTKAGTYGNMLILEMPHDEEPDIYDTIALALKLREVQFVTSQFAALPPSQVKKASNSSTVKAGQKDGGATTPQGSTLFGLIFGGG